MALVLIALILMARRTLRASFTLGSLLTVRSPLTLGSLLTLRPPFALRTLLLTLILLALISLAPLLKRPRRILLLHLRFNLLQFSRAQKSVKPEDGSQKGICQSRQGRERISPEYSKRNRSQSYGDAQEMLFDLHRGNKHFDLI